MLATTEAESGHPTTCFSAADLVAAVFFAEMRFDPKNPQHPLADRFVLDEADAGLAPGVEALGMRAHVLPTVMRDDAGRAALARALMGLA